MIFNSIYPYICKKKKKKKKKISFEFQLPKDSLSQV